MPICSFCGRRRHFRGALPLHWPMVNAPGRMLELLGRQELEKKRIEDGRAAVLEMEGFRGGGGRCVGWGLCRVCCVGS